MAKQAAIEQDGTIIEALSNAMFRVELETVMLLRLIFPVKCVCTILKFYRAIELKWNVALRFIKRTDIVPIQISLPPDPLKGQYVQDVKQSNFEIK